MLLSFGLLARRAPLGLIIAAGLTLSGCSNQVETLTPELQATMMSNLQAGKQTLTCGMGCYLTWSTQVSSVQGLDLAEKWQDLAIKVMQIGYGSDLAYYYLGQSAQGLGYHQAAIDYYHYSLAIAGGDNALLKCEGAQSVAGDPCQGVNLADAVPQLIQASQNVLDQQAADAAAAAAPVHHHRVLRPSSSFVTPPPAPPAVGSSPDGGFATPPPPPPQ